MTSRASRSSAAEASVAAAYLGTEARSRRKRVRVAAAQLGQQAVGPRGVTARRRPQADDRPVAGGALALDVRTELGPGPEPVFLGQDELGVAEQEPPGGPVTQHLGRPVPGGRIPASYERSKCLACLR